MKVEFRETDHVCSRRRRSMCTICHILGNLVLGELDIPSTTARREIRFQLVNLDVKQRSYGVIVVKLRRRSAQSKATAGYPRLTWILSHPKG